MSTTRERDEDEEVVQARSPKRAKLLDEDEELPLQTDLPSAAAQDDIESTENVEQKPESLLPPSHALLGVPEPSCSADGSLLRILESDVGISEYVGSNVSKIDGIIKQRFTDFLVYEVDLDSNIIHLKSLEKPDSTSKKGKVATLPGTIEPESADTTADVPTQNDIAEEVAKEPVTAPPEQQKAESIPPEEPMQQEDDEPWPERFTTALKPFLSDSIISQVRNLYLEGPEPPFVSDSGWAGRQTKGTEATTEEGSTSAPATVEEPEATTSGRGKRGRDRGGRGGRGGRRGGRGGGGDRQDHRKVLSEAIASKETRTGLHQVVRELFKGKLETETDTTAPPSDEGSKIVIKWSKRGGGRGGGRGGRSDRGERTDRGERAGFPPYIHFTLQKTNRDTQDALLHLSRSIHCNIKDLSVAGTKDKRGVTTQRVALRRGNKTVEDVWRLANGLNGRRTPEEVLTRRGDRGIRIADFNYRRAGLELGMLKGNAFVITLRNVQVDSLETIDRAMEIIKTKGFINYYGMQRFGTACVPTHSIGLAILKSEWQKAVSLIMQVRPGEHPDVVAARQAWLVDGDLDRALELMPRRVVAERCLLESFKKQKGDTRNAMGALSTIPRNLRLMYVHAYQSYVWNSIVSERIRMFGAEKPAVGDLVFETDDDAEEVEIAAEGADDALAEEAKPGQDDKMDVDEPASKSNKRRKPWEPPKVKVLTEGDLDKYSIFDVIMPLPGRDVSFPEGKLGDRYKEFLRADGLDPNNWVRKQKEYSLGGSYRKIMHMPKELSWSVLRYTDPDAPLAQADEDKLLGFDPPVIDEQGKFLALQIRLQLGTAAYATMALREVTKTETGAQYQSALTQASEDQKYKGWNEAEPEGSPVKE